eukprot:364548-Chlamydomonas_euryale.AAC.4
MSSLAKCGHLKRRVPSAKAGLPPNVGAVATLRLPGWQLLLKPPGHQKPDPPKHRNASICAIARTRCQRAIAITTFELHRIEDGRMDAWMDG